MRRQKQRRELCLEVHVFSFSGYHIGCVGKKGWTGQMSHEDAKIRRMLQQSCIFFVYVEVVI